MQGATIARTIGRRMQRLIVPSVTGRHDCSYDRSPRLIVRSVVGRNNCSYIGRWSLPLVARFPTMALAIYILQSFMIARPRVEIDRRMRPLLEIVANIADRLVAITTEYQDVVKATTRQHNKRAHIHTCTHARTRACIHSWMHTHKPKSILFIAW